MIHTQVFYAETKRFEQLSDPDLIGAICKNSQAILWVDLCDPSEAEFAKLEEAFGFHPLAMEDCRHPHQRPKIDDYHGYYFMVVYEARYTEQNELRLQELDLFLGPNFLVTVHRNEIPALQRADRLWKGWTDLIHHGAGLLAYLVIDSVVDEYFPVLDAISDEIDEYEDLLFENNDDETLSEIFTIKKNLLLLRRTAAPLRDVFNTLLRREQPVFPREVQYYFQDIFDHLIRVSDMIDNLRDLLGSTIDVYLSIQSNRMNMVMKRLTSLSTILMSAGLVSGIYGMNFVHMPELEWRYGYFGALGFMAVLALGLLIFFRRIKWL